MRWVIAVALLVACGKDKSDGASTSGSAATPSDKAGPQALGDTGVVVDVPAGWTVEDQSVQQMPVFRISKGKAHVSVKRWMIAPKDIEELYVKPDECGSAKEPGVKETTPAGTMYVQCKKLLPNEGGGEIEVTHATAALPIEKGAMRCFFTTPEDATAQISICKSLRKK